VTKRKMLGSADGHRCPRCKDRVYFAEEIIAMGHHWHRSCFLCGNSKCGKRLDSRTCADHAGEAYCTTCYGKLFGPKGYGFGQGAGVLSMDSGDPDTVVTSNISSYAQAQVASILENGSNNNGRHDFKNQTGAAKNGSGTGGSGRSYGGTEVCRRCSKPVYMAERMIGAGAAWHKITCFTCLECKRRLESTTLCEKDGEIYCKTCYGKQWGPKGYGYGVGAGTLQMQASDISIKK